MTDPLTMTLDAAYSGVKNGNWGLVLSVAACVLCLANSLFGFVGSVPLLRNALVVIGILAIGTWWLKPKSSISPKTPVVQK